MFDQLMRLTSHQGSQFYQLLEPLSENFANFNTYGYKARRFEMYLRPDGVTDMVRRTDYKQGPIEITQREFDVAINGPGFIPVTQPNGELAYTRNGSFKRNNEGFLVTQFGDLVGTGIKIPMVYENIEINKNGEVNVIEQRGMEPKKLGDIPVVVFANPEGLEVIGKNLLTASKESGLPTKLEKHEFIEQRKLERPNVDVENTAMSILKLNTGVLANMKLVKFIDEIYREGVNLRQ